MRPITGWTGANVYVSPTSDPAAGQTYSVTFPTEAGTVYGGTLDLTAGTLTVDRWYAVYDGSENWYTSGDPSGEVIKYYLAGQIPAQGKSFTVDDVESSIAKKSADGQTIAVAGTFAIRAFATTRGWVGFAVSQSLYPTVTEFKAMLASLAQNNTPAQVVAKTITKTTYQLTPVQIAALAGLNNVWADCGSVELAYVKDVKIEEMIAEESDITASKAFTAGEYVIVKDKLYKVTADVSAGAELVPGTNIEETTVGDELSEIDEDISEIGEDVSELKTQLTGETPVSALSHFTIGAMSFGSTPHINPDFTNACASTDFMEFDVDTVLHVDPEYQTMRYYYNEETEKWVWTEPWSAGDKTVEANKIWGISIRKGEGGSETANIPLYTSKVTITNVIGEHTKEIEKLNEDIEDINDELDAFPNVENNTLSYDLAVSDENDYTLVEYKNGHIKTKNFDSEKLFSKTYKGAEMPFGKHYYSAEKYMDMNYTPQTYIEGGVCFGNYYFQFSENMTTVGVFDLSTKQHIYTWTNPSSGDHCNSANFGNEYYSDSDMFPLLYVSGQRTHKIYVYRVTESNSTYDFTLVQTITFGDSTATKIYYPDYSIDIANRHIIASGYVANSYDASGNKTIISVYNLPVLNDGDTTIAESDKVKTFILPEAFTGSQGAFAIGGKVYEVFGFSNPRYIVAFDTLSERISSIVDITNDIAAEPEALFVYNKDLFVASQDLVITKFIF